MFRLSNNKNTQPDFLPSDLKEGEGVLNQETVSRASALGRDALSTGSCENRHYFLRDRLEIPKNTYGEGLKIPKEWYEDMPLSRKRIRLWNWENSSSSSVSSEDSSLTDNCQWTLSSSVSSEDSFQVGRWGKTLSSSVCGASYNFRKRSRLNSIISDIQALNTLREWDQGLNDKLHLNLAIAVSSEEKKHIAFILNEKPTLEDIMALFSEWKVPEEDRGFIGIFFQNTSEKSHKLALLKDREIKSEVSMFFILLHLGTRSLDGFLPFSVVSRSHMLQNLEVKLNERLQTFNSENPEASTTEMSCDSKLKKEYLNLLEFIKNELEILEKKKDPEEIRVNREALFRRTLSRMEKRSEGGSAMHSSLEPSQASSNLPLFSCVKSNNGNRIVVTFKRTYSRAKTVFPKYVKKVPPVVVKSFNKKELSETQEVACQVQSETQEVACQVQSETQEIACQVQSETQEIACQAQSETQEIACQAQSETQEVASLTDGSEFQTLHFLTEAQVQELKSLMQKTDACISKVESGVKKFLNAISCFGYQRRDGFPIEFEFDFTSHNMLDDEKVRPFVMQHYTNVIANCGQLSFQNSFEPMEGMKLNLFHQNLGMFLCAFGLGKKDKALEFSRLIKAYDIQEQEEALQSLDGQLKILWNKIKASLGSSFSSVTPGNTFSEAKILKSFIESLELNRGSSTEGIVMLEPKEVPHILKPCIRRMHYHANIWLNPSHVIQDHIQIQLNTLYQSQSILDQLESGLDLAHRPSCRFSSGILPQSSVAPQPIELILNNLWKALLYASTRAVFCIEECGKEFVSNSYKTESIPYSVFFSVFYKQKMGGYLSRVFEHVDIKNFPQMLALIKQSPL